MGLRTKAYFGGVLLAFFSSMAAALGLGEIKLHSALNQPLNAEIQLLHVRGLSQNEIIVAIATPDEFTRAGVERNFFVTDLQFALDLNAPQGPIVRVTSAQPVREPFLNFIVSARWPSGKLLREYTLLVDLPVFSGAQSAPVQAASPTRTQPTSTPSATQSASQTRSSQPQPESSAPASSYAADTYGPVGANETLWSIASRSRPDSSVSVQQTMLAIQRLNPQAFINGNINLLRRGQVLRIPDKEEIQQLSSRDAIQQVAAQNQRWNARSSDKAQLEGSKSLSPTRSEPATIEGRVKLSSSSAAATAGQGAGSEGSDGQVSEALNQAQEELDAADRENADLKSRIQSMEEQIQTMERLVEVSSEEMRALELAAQQVNQGETEATAGTDLATNQESAETAEQEAIERETTATVAETEQAVEAVAPAESEAAPEVASQPVQTPPAQKSWLDLAMDNILYIGIALVVLVLAVVLYLFKRNRDDDYEEYDDYDTEDDMDLSLAGDIEGENDKTVPLHGYDDVEEFVEEEHALAEAETEDVVGECDIHIAYGQYDQAEEKLLRALEQDPTNIAVRLKLLEVFSRQDDADSFDQHYARLRLAGDTEAIDRASMMRSSIDGIGPFDESRYDASELAIAPDGDTRFETAEDGAFDTDDRLDFDFNDVDELVDSSSSTITESDDFSADSLDFDLTQDDDVTRVPGVSSAANANDELGDLDFDLGELEESSPAHNDLTASKDPTEDSDILGDIDFETSDGETDVFEDDKTEDDLAADFDLEFGESERFTSEFSNDLVAERTSGPNEEDAFDFADLELTDTESAKGDSAADQMDDLDFDLDRDLERAQALAEEPPVLSAATQADSTELDGLGFDDLESLDMDDDATSPVEEQASAGDLSGRSTENSGSDFDVDFDLDKDVNLDELDHELDALASDFDNANVDMEEPVLDFDEEVEGDTQRLGSTNDALADLDIDDADGIEGGATLRSDAAEASEGVANSDFEIPDFDPENDDDSNLDFLSDNDETATKLDLARAYIDMGDSDGAKDILDEIIDEGNDQQKQEAEALLARIG